MMLYMDCRMQIGFGDSILTVSWEEFGMDLSATSALQG